MTTQVPEDPFAEFEPDEAAQADYVLRGAVNGSDLAIAASLGGAFLVYREFMRRRLRKKIDSIDAKDPDDINREALRIFNSFVPAWTAMVGPVLLRGYLNGISETGLVMDSEFLTRLADNYAYSLGVHLNNVSADAMVRGYAAQVNRKVPFKIALANVIDAFGVTNRTAKSLNNIVGAKEDAKLSETLMPSVKKQRAEALIAASIKERADTVGEQESWNAKQQGKQVVWLYAQRKGIIPDNATRVWETADDELVCPHCGPMHKVEQSISEPFEVPNVGKFWSPPLHPRCRCEVKLKAHILTDLVDEVAFSGFQRRWSDEPEVAVAKADDWEPKEHPRSERSGRFVRTGFAEPDELDALLRDVELKAAAPAGPTLRPAKGSLTNGPSLRGAKPSLRPVTKPTLRTAGMKPQLSNAKLSTARMKIQARPRMSPAEMKKTARMERARMDGKIQAKVGDITGVVEPKEFKQPNYEGLQRTSEDMYAIIDGQNVRLRNDHVTIDGSEVIGGLEILGDKLKEIEMQQDYDFCQLATDNDDQYEYGLTPMEGGEFLFDEHVIMQAVEWSRAQHQTDRLLGEDWVSVPVLKLVNRDSGVEFDEDTDEITDATEDDWEMQQTGYEDVRVSTIAEMFGTDQYVKRNQPSVVRLNLVRDNDVDYDGAGRPYANPVDNYKVSDPINVTVRGRTYQGFHLEPGWLD